MRITASALAGWAFVLSACSSTASPDGARSDAADIVVLPDVTNADGGGVCCPVTAAQGCSPRGYFGGWASQASECREQAAFDGCPFVLGTDSHGCAALLNPPCMRPCGSSTLDVVDTVDVPAPTDTPDVPARTDTSDTPAPSDVVPPPDAGACDNTGTGACPAGLSCLCCPAGGPAQNCVCTTACSSAGECTSVDRPICNRDMFGSGRGICTSATFRCAWGSVCAAGGTRIATASGERVIEDIAVGDRVYGARDGHFALVRVVQVSRTRVWNHVMVNLSLRSGRSVRMSPGHPSIDGRRFVDLARGDLLGGAEIASSEVAPYEQAFTYDILTDGDDGAYVAEGVLVGSTLAP